LRNALAAGRDLPEPPPNAPSPFAFADTDRVRAIFAEAGFARVSFDAIDEPMYFGPDTERAFAGVSKLGIVNGLLADLDETRRREALDLLRETLEQHQTPDGVLLGTSAWIVRATTTQEQEGS